VRGCGGTKERRPWKERAAYPIGGTEAKSRLLGGRNGFSGFIRSESSGVGGERRMAEKALDWEEKVTGGSASREEKGRPGGFHGT